MSDDEIKVWRERLESLWNNNGDCGSCGWHGTLYEHEVEDGDIQWAIEKNNGILELGCVSEDDDRGSHRGVKINLMEKP